jgi:hypothetical protein
MTMVDRVAQAICAESATLDWRDYRDEARRAIEAMKELGQRYQDDGYPTTSEAFWQTMIEAALGEAPGGKVL